MLFLPSSFQKKKLWKSFSSKRTEFWLELKKLEKLLIRLDKTSSQYEIGTASWTKFGNWAESSTKAKNQNFNRSSLFKVWLFVNRWKQLLITNWTKLSFVENFCLIYRLSIWIWISSTQELGILFAIRRE